MRTHVKAPIQTTRLTCSNALTLGADTSKAELEVERLAAQAENFPPQVEYTDEELNAMELEHACGPIHW